MVVGAADPDAAFLGFCFGCGSGGFGVGFPDRGLLDVGELVAGDGVDDVGDAVVDDGGGFQREGDAVLGDLAGLPRGRVAGLDAFPDEWEPGGEGDALAEVAGGGHGGDSGDGAVFGGGEFGDLGAAFAAVDVGAFATGKAGAVGGDRVEGGVVLGEQDLVEFAAPLTLMGGFDPGEGLGGVAGGELGGEHVFDYTPQVLRQQTSEGLFRLIHKGKRHTRPEGKNV